MKKRIKIQGGLVFLAVILFILFSRFIIPSWKKEAWDEFFDIAGIVLVLSGFLLRIIARGYKEEVSQGGDKLVTDGPYALIRNPMYLGTLLIGTGVISVLLKFWTLAIFLIVYLFIYVPQIKREERILLKRFGQDYEKYNRCVPKYFPGIGGLLNLKTQISLLNLQWIKKEISPLILTIIFIFIIEIWQDVALFGVREIISESVELLLVVLAFIVIVSILAARRI